MNCNLCKQTLKDTEEQVSDSTGFRYAHRICVENYNLGFEQAKVYWDNHARLAGFPGSQMMYTTIQQARADLSDTLHEGHTVDVDGFYLVVTSPKCFCAVPHHYHGYPVKRITRKE